MDNQEERDCNSYLATDPKELERQILDSNVPKNEREWWAKRRIEDLIDFAIWMTGCGYDFTQHSYFCERRDKLLKLPLSSDSSEKLYPDIFLVNHRRGKE